MRWLLLLTTLCGCNLIRGPRRDHECRSVLRSIMASEFAFYSEHQRYSIHPHELGFAPPLGNRYLYLFDDGAELTRRDDQPSASPERSIGYGPDTSKRGITVEELLASVPPAVREMLGLRGACPHCEITVACVGNLDDDPDVDVWTASSENRPFSARGTPLRFATDLQSR